MTQLTRWGFDPLDIVWKNFFDPDSHFNTITEKINYPVDIYETEKGLRFELAVVGLEKKDITIEVEGNTLRISHEREAESNRTYLQKGIAKRSFNLAWRISSSYDLSKLEATMDKGLLILDVPIDAVKAPKLIEIK